MKQLIQLFAQIALLRRGPQDLPASTLLLALTVSAYLAVNLVVSSVLPPVKSWPAQVLVDTLFTLAWYVALLKLVGRSERILQTATAVFGLQGLLSPLLIASDWLMLRLGEDALWQVPVACAGLLLIIWLVAASSQIVKAATEGFEAAQLTPAPDVVLVGNVMTRGQPVIEALLESGLPFASGPEWLAREVLKGRWVLAVAGTHGKTTSASLLAWILEHAGRNPGFLIGGVPANFGVSARLGAAPCFVIEADEYDTAFFDKRAKFVHYSPRTLILNNLEYDHADIYPDVGAIQRQFHHLVRIVPGGGRIVWNAADALLRDTLQMGCWTPLEGFAREP